MAFSFTPPLRLRGLAGNGRETRLSLFRIVLLGLANPPPLFLLPSFPRLHQPSKSHRSRRERTPTADTRVRHARREQKKGLDLTMRCDAMLTSRYWRRHSDGEDKGSIVKAKQGEVRDTFAGSHLLPFSPHPESLLSPGRTRPPTTTRISLASRPFVARLVSPVLELDVIERRRDVGSSMRRVFFLQQFGTGTSPEVRGEGIRGLILGGGRRRGGRRGRVA